MTDTIQRLVAENTRLRAMLAVIGDVAALRGQDGQDFDYWAGAQHLIAICVATAAREFLAGDAAAQANYPGILRALAADAAAGVQARSQA